MRPELPVAVGRLRDELAAARLELEVPGAADARRARDDLVAQSDDYLLPRLLQMDAPVLMVVGGSTGAGKSTLVDRLMNRSSSRPRESFVRRPQGPVLASHPDNLQSVRGRRILLASPGRPAAPPAPRRPLPLMPGPTLPWGLALLDSPDIDSVLPKNTGQPDLNAPADGSLLGGRRAPVPRAPVPWSPLARGIEERHLHSPRPRPQGHQRKVTSQAWSKMIRYTYPQHGNTT